MLGRIYRPIYSCVPLFNRNLTTKNSERGSTLATALIIHEKNHFIAVRSEYALLRLKYPGHVVKLQALMENDGKYYDRIDILTADGKQLKIYFDITRCFSSLEMNKETSLKQEPTGSKT